MLFQTLLFASTASATCLHGLSMFKRQEPAEGEVPIGKFGYTGLTGPHNWASLAPENEACKAGKNQSPINVDDSIPLATENPVMTIEEQAVEFENLGTTIEVVVNGTTSFAGTDFRLQQFHLHTPSEHRIGEEYYPIEAHFVHEGVTDPTALTVISVLFDLNSNSSATSPILSGLVPHMSAIEKAGTKTPIEEGLDFTELINHVQTSELFQYSGSLTTPPCAEGVTFLIAKAPLSVDVDTFNAIKSVVKFNARFTQNHLGEHNLINVGMVAGTTMQLEPPAVEEPSLINGTAPANGTEAAPTEVAAGVGEAPASITKGATVVISEVAGQPTSLVGVIVKGR